MKKIIILLIFINFISTALFCNVRGLIPLDGSVTPVKIDATNTPTSSNVLIYDGADFSWGTVVAESEFWEKTGDVITTKVTAEDNLQIGSEPLLLTNTASKNIGIGLSSPYSNAKLSIKENVTDNFVLRLNNSANSEANGLLIEGSGLNPTSNHLLSIRQSVDSTSNEVLRVNGLGTLILDSVASASAALYMSGGLAGNDEGAEIKLYMTDDYDDIYENWRIDIYKDILRFGLTGSTYMNILSNGNIGIGNTTLLSAYQKLSVDGSVRLGLNNSRETIVGDNDLALGSDGNILIVSDINTTGPALDILFGAGSYSASPTADFTTFFPDLKPRFEHMRIKGNTGYVGIATSTPSYVLTVAGTANVESLIVANSDVLNSVATGNADNDKLVTQGYVDDRIPENTIYVKTAADFPTPSGNIIQLENKTYVISSTVVVSNQLRFPSSGNSALMALGPGIGTLAYVGTSNFIIGDLAANSFHTITNGLTLYGNQGATLFNVTGNYTALLYTREMISDNFGDLGIITSIAITIRSCSLTTMGQGLIVDNIRSLSVQDCFLGPWVNNVGTYYFKTQNTINLLNIVNNEILLQANERYLNLTGTITKGSISQQQINVPALFFFPGSQDQSTLTLFFSDNTGIKDSTVSSEFILNSNVLTTDIPAVDAWIVINATTWTFDNEERVTGNNLGKATYLGLEPINAVLDSNINLEPSTGTNKLLRASFVNLHSHDAFVVTFNNTTNTVNEPATSLNNNDTISFFNSPGTLPAELRKDALYYVINKATNNYQVSYVQGGAAITFTDDGTPTNNYSLAYLIGAPGRANIDSADPRDIIPQAFAPLETSDEILMFVKNESDDTDIDVLNAYYRFIKN